MKSIKFLSSILFEQGPPSRVAVAKANPSTARAATPPATATPTISAADLAKEKADLTLKLNKGFEYLSNWLVGMFSTASAPQWEPWKHWNGDEELKAWDEFFIPQWSAECAETLAELQKDVKTLADNVATGKKYADDGNMRALDTKMQGNLKIVQSWPTDNGPLKTAFVNNDSTDDIYRWTINYTNDFTPAPGQIGRAHV